ncbi:GlxA family transcriptional regulator [Rheinheimera aquimaris]|jgi:AraC family transcriptional activator FtrA|uniref:GlxA family transcriptional regulator n=1 Tax=Rheinheimera aquimaris TaxID=412437 RepID=UPI0010665274|nr:helix-turn-helix domain-containing protein [Rheinheimera aquimaris]MCD1598538.1 helix-turn-helix domain-containing protein [Rheinheimera aquimaris]
MRVIILLTEQLSLFELGCAVELFAMPRPEFQPWYSTEILSLSAGSYNGLAGSSLQCEQVDTLPPADLLLIPSFPVSVTEPDPRLIAELQRHYQQGGRIISFCSGSFLLAAAGLLDNRIATTHWRYAGQFKQRYPKLEYKDNILYHYDGVIGCSAGSAAAIDLGIEVIRRDFGYHCANSVARRLVLPAHRSGGQAQFVEKPLTLTKSGISQALDWATSNLSAQLSIDDIAKKANMSRRTFDRHINKHYNMTALQWLTERKLDSAKSLLEASELSIDEIAVKAGFDNAVTLRHNFRKYLSVSPMQYKRTFLRS